MNQTNTMPIRSRWSAVTGLTLASVLAMSFALGVSGASAGRTDPPGRDDANHCINEFDVDLNELYGISDQFRNRDCQVVSAGEHWVIGPLVWIVNQGADSIYPNGYVQSQPEPIDDFTSKLVSIRVVVDGGTKRRGFESSRPARRCAPTSTSISSSPASSVRPTRWLRSCRACVR